jgi:flagellar secretion chaperone FliS
MLFEGAIRSLDRAEGGFSMDDPAQGNEAIHNNIQRTQEILHELNMALDLENGGELAKTLRALYEYMDRRLLESNTTKTTAGVIEARRHLTVLREAWSQMLQGQPGGAPARSMMAAA